MLCSADGGGLNYQSNDNTSRGLTATLRPPRECKAMSRIARRSVESTNKFLVVDVACRLLKKCWNGTAATNATENIGDRNGDGDSEIPPQYTLLSNRNRFRKSHVPLQQLRQGVCFLCSITTWGSGTAYICFVDVNKLISSFLVFSFRSSYLVLSLVFSICYFGFIGIFALVYQGVSLFYPQCISSGGQMIGSGEGARLYADCFQLSWQTFGTVGYGSIYPTTGASDYFVPTGCVAVGAFASFEAYLGVLFAGMTAAILFRKVLRTQNYAQALFSDPIVVRFGKKELEDGHGHNIITRNRKDVISSKVSDLGLGERLSSASLLTVEEEDDNAKQCIPCPSLEFRVVNRLHSVKSGEIVEATLDCVAILDHLHSESLSGDVDNTTDSSSSRQLRAKQKSMPNIRRVNSDSPTNRHHRVRQRSSLADFANAIRDANKKEEKDAFHEPDSKTPNVFTSISLESNTNPYFNRTWYGRHRLDENSPLLTPAVRDRIKNTGGYWPSDLNNYESIKRSLHFRHILVCISGTSNATAATVYAQKVYDLVDVNVGYRFVPMNYHADDGSLRTDEYLLNAVCEQRGGGAEPFQ